VWFWVYPNRPELFTMGVFLAGACIVGQFSYFGDYLPKVFPVHLRGTGGAFATNVGGRMIGTSAAFLTTGVIAPLLSSEGPVTPQAHDSVLTPTYTPLPTDEPDVSQKRVFFGGINVYLQQKLSLFRHTPWFFDRLLDGRGLLNWVSRFAVRTEAEVLGGLTV